MPGDALKFRKKEEGTMFKKLIADRGVQASAAAAPVLAIATWLSGDLVWIVGILWVVWAIAATVTIVRAVRAVRAVRRPEAAL